MEPGKVFNATTLSPKDVVIRGQGQCFNLIDSQPYAEAMTATEIHMTGNSSPKAHLLARPTYLFAPARQV